MKNNMKTKNTTKISENQKNLIKEIKFVRDNPVKGMTTLYVCGINVMSINIDSGEYIAIIPFRDIDIGLGFYRKTDEYGLRRYRLQTIIWVGDIISNLQKIRNQLTSFYGEIGEIEPQTNHNIECSHCGHTWYTRSFLKYTECPNCRCTTRNPNHEPIQEAEYKAEIGFKAHIYHEPIDDYY